MAFYTKLCKNIKVFLVYVKKPECPARKSGRSQREARKGMGHQDLKPTDVVGANGVVGPPHSLQVKMAFSLEEASCGSTGFFTHRVRTKERMCRLR